MQIDIQEIPAFSRARPVLEKIEDAGFEAYFVGGAVRDALLNKEISDIDLATSAFPAEIKAIFKRTIDVGIEHGTVMVLFGDESYEVTTFRTESSYQDYRRPDQVTFVRSLEEDLLRRDFTINALALDREGKIIDLFSGLADLKAQTIRAVGHPNERFNEDALRMMRAVRFASQLSFEIEEDTLTGIENNRDLLLKIAVERIHVEFIKMMQGKDLAKGLHSFIQTGLYQYCPALEGHLQGLERFYELKGPILTESQVWTLISHYLRIEPKDLRAFLKKWKCSNQIIDQSQKQAAYLNLKLEGRAGKKDLYQIGLASALEVEYLLGIMGYNSQADLLADDYQNLPIKSKKDLAINGGLILEVSQRKSGPWLGDILDELEEKVVLGQLDNDKDVLLAYVEKSLAE